MKILIFTLWFEDASGCFVGLGCIWDAKGVASWHCSVSWSPATCHALTRHWGSRVSNGYLNPPSQRTWSPLLCPAVFRSLGTSFSALGSHLFGVWNVLFWFWVKPQEKGFYFWNAHFQLYIPLDGIRFSGIGICTNGILSHISSLAVETCCFVRERVVLWSVSSISCPSHAACFGKERECFQRHRGHGTWTICLSGEKPNGSNKFLQCARHFAKNFTWMILFIPSILIYSHFPMRKLRFMGMK